MPLEGLATAIFERKDGQHVVSSAVVSGTSHDQICLEHGVQTEVDPHSENNNARVALMKVLREIDSRRAQIVEIGENKKMFVPLPIVHGFTEHHAELEYSRMIKSAFPEYFTGVRAPKRVRKTNDLLEHLFREYHHDHAPAPGHKEQPSRIVTHPYSFFLPDDPAGTRTHALTPKEQVVDMLLKTLLQHAKAGHPKAREQLVVMAKNEARIHIEHLLRKGILEETRFLQIVAPTEAFKQSATFTYLEWSNLKDLFVWEIISRMRHQHNVCLKTPNDKSSPAFVDIAATFLADVWMKIYFERTGKVAQFKNVFAKHR